MIAIIALVAVIGFSMAACGDDDDDLSGTYTGTAMGIPITLTITPPSTYTMAMPPFGTETGTYAVSGNTITFTSSEGDVSTGTLSNNSKTITIVEEDIGTIVLKK